jgi:hypothetical protein
VISGRVWNSLVCLRAGRHYPFLLEEGSVSINRLVAKYLVEHAQLSELRVCQFDLMPGWNAYLTVREAQADLNRTVAGQGMGIEGRMIDHSFLAISTRQHIKG